MVFVAARSSPLSGPVFARSLTPARRPVTAVLTALVKYSKAVQTDAMACVLITPTKSDGTLVIRQ